MTTTSVETTQQLQQHNLEKMLEINDHLLVDHHVNSSLDEASAANELIESIRQVGNSDDQNAVVNVVLEHFRKRLGVSLTSLNAATEQIEQTISKVSTSRMLGSIRMDRFDELFEVDYRTLTILRDLGEQLEKRGAVSAPIASNYRLSILNPDGVKKLTCGDIIDLVRSFRDLASNTKLVVILDEIEELISRFDDVQNEEDHPDHRADLAYTEDQLVQAVAQVKAVADELSHERGVLETSHKPFTIMPIDEDNKNLLLILTYEMLEADDCQARVDRFIKGMRNAYSRATVAHADAVLRLVYEIMVKRLRVLDAASHYLNLSIAEKKKKS